MAIREHKKDKQISKVMGKRGGRQDVTCQFRKIHVRLFVDIILSHFEYI